MVPFESLGTVSYSHSIATMAVSLAVSTQYTKATDTHSDRQTPHDALMHRAEKTRHVTRSRNDSLWGT